MSRLIIENLTEEQAIALADWFEGQGEQDCYEWFYEQNVPSPKVDCSKDYVTDGDDLIIYIED